MKSLVERYEKLEKLEDSDIFPIMHITKAMKKGDIELTLNGEGVCIRAKTLGEAKDMIIPATLDSGSRSGSAIFPHALFDDMSYLALNDKKREMYLKQLNEWRGENKKLNSIYSYVQENRFVEDMEKFGITHTDKTFIKFKVEIKGDLEADLSKDPIVINHWIDYYSNLELFKKEDLDYITGKRSKVSAKHPKGTNKNTNSAVLVVSDEKNIRRNSIGFNSSQKAHAMLRYLVANYGFKCDTGVIVTYSLGEDINLPKWYSSSDGIIEGVEDDFGDIATHEESIETILDKNYAKAMRNALLGLGKSENLKKHTNRIAIIALDAATTGRLSVTYYQELDAHEFHEKIVNWHEKCNWHMERWMGDKKNRTKVEYISSPKIDDIIKVAFGDTKGDSYTKIQKRAREQILHSMFSGKPIDKGYVTSALRRVNSPFSFEEWEYRSYVNIACALLKMYYSNKGDEISVKLEEDRTDRSYLYGRLLAYAEKIESWARSKRGEKNYVTNSLRYRSRFSQKPFSTWQLIDSQLNPYREILKGMVYQNQIDEIKALFESLEEFENNIPLDGKYLMGYSLQRLELNPRKELEENIEEEINDE